MLSNWICFPLWCLAAWKFFDDRIPHEEYHLCKFFGESYVDYAKVTPIGIPFLEGYVEWLLKEREKEKEQ